MHDDEIEAYLNAVSSYEKEKVQAASAWKTAFLNLAKGRLTCDVSYTMHDTEATAQTTVDAATQTLAKQPARPVLGGAWPPKALQVAHDEFLAALKHELEARRVKPSL